MAENKTRPTKLSVAAFINALTDPARRADAKTLIKLMQRATGEKPQMWGPSIIGFGSYHYTYESGREGDMPIVGFSPRKAATSSNCMPTQRPHDSGTSAEHQRLQRFCTAWPDPATAKRCCRSSARTPPARAASTSKSSRMWTRRCCRTWSSEPLLLRERGSL